MCVLNRMGVLIACVILCVKINHNEMRLTCIVDGCVQVFDSIRHPSFDYGGSGAQRRLLFSEPTNRGFFTAMQFSGRKVLSLSPHTRFCDWRTEYHLAFVTLFLQLS